MKLYNHQVRAVDWMRGLETGPRMHAEQPRGGILAHEMGLGKTITMLKYIESQDDAPSLIVTPKSVLLHWRSEAIDKTSITSEEIVVYHGNRRRESVFGAQTRIVLTTFDIVRLEHQGSGPLSTMTWKRVVLDEAHRIAEAGSKTACAIRALKSPNRWAITGTPFRNCLSDIIALCKFVGVAPYHRTEWWRSHANNPTSVQKWRETYMNMQPKNVLNLPPVVEQEMKLSKTPMHCELEKHMHRFHGKDGNPTNGTDNATHENELLKILRTRQLCDHFALLFPKKFVNFLVTPATVENDVCPLFPQEKADCRFACPRNCRVSSSCLKQCLFCPKCCLLLSRRDGMLVDGFCHSEKTRALCKFVRQTLQQDSTSKFVVFSQWTSFLDVLQRLFDHMNVNYMRFDGAVNSIEERFEVINKFQQDQDIPVLLTSLGAGGEGITLTLANHVVLMEPYWNSSIEQQAIDRVHRIGQVRNVHVTRMFMENTVETWVKQIKQAKRVELSVLLHGEKNNGRVNVNFSLTNRKVVASMKDTFHTVPIDLLKSLQKQNRRDKKRRHHNLSMFVRVKKNKK